MRENRTIEVYLDNGVVFTYSVANETKAREHSVAIINGGYRHNDGETFEHYPPWRILKVKVSGGPMKTRYLDNATGT